MNSLRLIEKDFSAFFRAPSEIAPQSLGISPLKQDLQRFLDPRKNPLFRSTDDMTYFTAHRGDRVVGRILAHIHRSSNERHQVNQAYFGFFECEDNQETAHALLSAAERFARAHGMTQIQGNMNMTAMQQMGVMTDGFDKAPYSDQVYSAAYLPKLLEAEGFSRFFPMSTFELILKDYRQELLITEKNAGALSGKNIRIESISKNRIQQGLADARVVLNSGFDKNPFFVPVTPEEFYFQAKDLSWVIDPRITTFAFQGDRAVGVAICIPDLNPLLKATKSKLSLATPWHYLQFRRNRKRAVIIYYSVVEDLHGQGIMAHVLNRTLLSLKESGYESVGMTWIADENKSSLRQMEKIGGVPMHKLHLFKKELQ